MRLFIDLDSVVVDFVHNIAQHFKIPKDEFYRRWPVGVYDVYHAVGITNDELWAAMHQLDDSFWESMPEFSWSKELWEKCNTYGETHFLTAPVSNPACLAGKYKWMQNFTNDKEFNRYFIGKAKWCCARWNHILIDDKESNVSSFQREGGEAILFPAHGNKLHSLSQNPMPYFHEELDRIVHSIWEKEAASILGA